ncbi:MAG: hypothetical protein Q8N53_09085 [Longimicrobiales bacterium]|nr:hypothetical protein [Longimicrobiales bacterium]
MDLPKDTGSDGERRYEAVERDILERVRGRHRRHTRNVLILALLAGAALGWGLGASSNRSLEQCIEDNLRTGDQDLTAEAMELLRRMERGERAEPSRR